MDGASGASGGTEEIHTGTWWEDQRERDDLENLGSKEMGWGSGLD
jgi:hypothetical protein